MPGDDARTAVLGRIRAALRDVPEDERPEDVVVARDYATALPSGTDVVALFAERAGEYRATVHRVLDAAALPGALAEACARHGAGRVVVSPGVPEAWRPTAPALVEDAALDHAALDGADGVITGCAAAIALTGTIVLDGGPRSGRRALTLLPDLHLCVVEAAQVAGTLAEVLARLDPSRPLTFVSGPSATSDIELERVEGVHGPRRLEIFVVDGA